MNLAEKLLTITATFSDRQVAMMLAEKIIFYNKTDEYRYRIDHDIRPPRCMPCLVDFDWAVKDHVGIETPSKARARKWLTDALIAGYTVDEIDRNRKPSGLSHSVAIAHRRAANHQRPKLENDDDIPF